MKIANSGSAVFFFRFCLAESTGMGETGRKKMGHWEHNLFLNFFLCSFSLSKEARLVWCGAFDRSSQLAGTTQASLHSTLDSFEYFSSS